MEGVDPTCKRLLSLPGRFLQEIFSYNFPVNMLRAVAACRDLHSILAGQLKAAVRFERTEWVILGELQAADFNNRIGQFIEVKPENRSRCAVQVDGLSSVQRVRVPPYLTLDTPVLRDPGSRMLGFSLFKLYKYRNSNRGMVAAVRLHADGEMLARGPLEKFQSAASCLFSSTEIPKDLAAFAEQNGQSPVMADLGRPLLVRQVIPVIQLPQMEHRFCFPHTFLRGPGSGVARVDSVAWELQPGPGVVTWLDQRDFTLDDFWRVYTFIESHALVALEGPRRSEMELKTMWQESATQSDLVIEPVFHDESPAKISPDEARAVVEVQQESTIQHGSIPSGVADLACVVTFHRAPEAFDRALAQSDLGKRLRGMGQPVKPAWANGAKILVEGLTEETWTRACREAGLTIILRRSDVVLPANSLANIFAEVQKLPHDSRPRLKAGREMISIPDLGRFADISDDRHDRPGPSSSVRFTDPAQSSRDASSESSGGWSAFTDGVRNKILHVPLPPGYTSRTFIHEPEEAAITPRSEATQSESAASGMSFVNPRLFQFQ